MSWFITAFNAFLAWLKEIKPSLEKLGAFLFGQYVQSIKENEQRQKEKANASEVKIQKERDANAAADVVDRATPSQLERLRAWWNGNNLR